MSHLKFNYGIIGEMPCPICRNPMAFLPSGDIHVNCESRGSVFVENMVTLWRGCRNPLCPWSNVDGESVNS